MTHHEIMQIIRQVNGNSFCLWQSEQSKQLYGVIEESAYEYFILACSLHTLANMQYLKVSDVKKIMHVEEPQVICGNRQLLST